MDGDGEEVSNIPAPFFDEEVAPVATSDAEPPTIDDLITESRTIERVSRRNFRTLDDLRQLPMAGQEKITQLRGLRAPVPPEQQEMIKKVQELANGVFGKGVETLFHPKALSSINKRHRAVIALHLEGMKHHEIGDMLGLRTKDVRRIILDPLSQSIIQTAYNAHGEEVKALWGKAIDVIRHGLDSGTLKDRLACVDRLQRITEVMAGQSAKLGEEDRVQKDVRAAVAGELRRLTDKRAETIDVNFTEVPEGEKAPIH